MKKKMAMLRIVLPLLLWMLSYAPLAMAQQTPPHPKCATEEPTPEDLKKFQAIYGGEKSGLGSCDFTQLPGPYEIPVVIHMIEDLMDGGGDNCNEPNEYNKDDAQCTLDELNAAFPIAGVTFRLADYDVNGDPITGVTMRRSPFTNNAERLNRGPELARFPADQYLNIWLVNQINPDGSSGVANLPGTGTGGISMAKFAMPCYDDNPIPTAVSTTLVHELGHWLGLRHIWGNTDTPGVATNCNIDDSDFVPGYIAGGFVPCQGFDMFDDDTPQTMGFDIMTAPDCNTYAPCLDAMGNPIEIPFMDNYMDYTCENTNFSDWQIDVMRSVLCNPIANFGKAGLMLSTPFCGVQNPQNNNLTGVPFGCDDAFLVPLESEFFERSANDDIVGNSIVVQLINTEIVGFIDGQAVDHTSVHSTSGANLNTAVNYFNGPNCDYLVVRFGQNGVLDQDIAFELTIDETMTNDPDQTLPFTVIAIADADCAIEYLDINPNGSVQTSGNGRVFFELPFLDGLANFELSSINSFSLQANSNTFTLSIASDALQGGDVIDASLNFVPGAMDFPNLTAGAIQYIGFRLQSSCNTFYYGWVRLYTPFECDSELRVLDAAIQTQYGLPILAGQTQCGCDCERSIVATHHTFSELPGNEGDFESVRFLVESIGCNNSVNFPVAYEIETNLTLGPQYTTAELSNNILLINIVDDAVTTDFTMDVEFSLIPNGQQQCLGGENEFHLESEFYPEEATCVPVNQQVSESITVGINIGADAGPVYFDLQRNGFNYSIRDRSNFNLDLASPDILPNPSLTFTYTPTDIGQFHEIISGQLAEGDYYIPFIMDWACGDSRLAYLHVTMDCCGNLYLYDFVYANNPYFTQMTAGEMHCELPFDLSVWTETTFNAVIGNDEVCFTAADNKEHNFQYRVADSNSAWINVDPVSDCVSNDDLSACETYEYRMEYICYPYGSIWSDEFNDPAETDVYQTFGEGECEPMGDPIISFDGNVVVFTYNPTGVPSTATYDLYVYFDGNLVFESEGDADGNFYFTIDECGTYTYELIVQCCPGVTSDVITGTFVFDNEFFCCAPIECQSVFATGWSPHGWTLTDADGNEYDLPGGLPCWIDDFGDLIEDIILDNADCGTEDLNVCVNETNSGCLVTIENSPIDFISLEGNDSYDFENNGEHCGCDCEAPSPSFISNQVNCNNKLRVWIPSSLQGTTYRWRFRTVGTTGWAITTASTANWVWLGTIPECGAIEFELQIQCDDALGTWTEWFNHQVVEARALRPKINTIKLQCFDNHVIITAGVAGECQEIRWKNDDASPWTQRIAFTGVQQFFVSDFTNGEDFCVRVRRYCPDDTGDCPNDTRVSCETLSCFVPECGPVDPPEDPECECDYVFITDKTMGEEETANMNCSLEKTMNEINEACPGCSSRFAVIGMGGEKEQHVDHRLGCEPPTLGEEEWRPEAEDADVTSMLGTLYWWLERAGLEGLGGEGVEDPGHKCLKFVIMTNAGCDGFAETFDIGGVQYTAAGLAQLLEEEFGASISLVHYNEYDEDGNVTNSLAECESIGGLVTDETGVQIDKDSDCEPLTGLWDGTKSIKPFVLDELSNQAIDFTIFPNPFDNELNMAIKAERIGTATFQLFNAIGQQVWQEKLQLDKGANSFNLQPNLPSGAYYYTLEVDGNSRSGKLLRIE